MKLALLLIDINFSLHTDKMEKLEDIRFVEMKDSQYLQPYRMHYKVKLHFMYI